MYDIPNMRPRGCLLPETVRSMGVTRCADARIAPGQQKRRSIGLPNPIDTHVSADCFTYDRPMAEWKGTGAEGPAGWRGTIHH